MLATLHLVNAVSTGEILYSFIAGFKLDMSTIAYCVVAPLLFAIVYHLSKNQLFAKITDAITYFLIILNNLISFGEVSLYQEWRTKLNIQALIHFINPSEVFSSASWTLIFLFLIPLIIFSVAYCKVYSKIIKPYPETNSFSGLRKKITNTLFLLPIPVLLFVVLRGGFQRIPIYESDAIYSKCQLLNDAAINPMRYLARDYIEYRHNLRENPHRYMNSADAKALLNDLYSYPSDTTEIIISNNRPNVVIILLESWSTNLIKSYGGDEFTPFFDSLANEGIKFINFYPAGYASDQGIPAVLSSYPSSFKTAIINEYKKISSLPCINIDLKKAGYNSSFVFGGDLNYGNLKAYVFNKGFDIVKEEYDFDKSLKRGALGIPDMPMALEFTTILNSQTQPFLGCWFTLSSHSPYDFPDKKIDTNKDDYELSVQYADEALRIFFRDAKRQPWYDNTLFVLVADHSHNSRKNFDLVNKEYHRIPLLLFGNVIKPEWRKKEITSAFSHLDITPTLLKQLGLGTENYTWGKNMFNPYSSHFAYYCYYYGAGMVSDSAYISLHRALGQPIDYSGKNPEEIKKLTKQLKAFQQVFYDDFLSR